MESQTWLIDNGRDRLPRRDSSSEKPGALIPTREMLEEDGLYEAQERWFLIEFDD